jgi:hypothetical protein
MRAYVPLSALGDDAIDVCGQRIPSLIRCTYVVPSAKRPTPPAQWLIGIPFTYDRGDADLPAEAEPAAPGREHLDAAGLLRLPSVAIVQVGHYLAHLHLLVGGKDALCGASFCDRHAQPSASER